MSDRLVKYCLVMGLPRSGTTLLATRLNCDERVLGLLETQLTKRILYSIRNRDYSLSSAVEYVRASEKLEESIPYEVDFSLLIDCLSSFGEEQSLVALLVKVGKCFRYQGVFNEGVECIVEKNPSFTFWLHELNELLPGVSRVWMFRDPRAFVASRIQKINPLNRLNHPIFLTLLWREYVKIYISEKRGCDILIRYEDLVSDYDGVLVGFSDFLGLNPVLRVNSEKTYFDFEEGFETERKQVKFQDLSREVNTDRLNSWGEILSPRLIRRIDVLTYGVSSRSSLYEFEKPSFISLVFVWLGASFWFVLVKLYILIIRVRKGK